jgi:hypothetical protein
LSHDPPSACSKRGTHAQLTRAPRATNEQEVGKIDTGNKQNETNRCPQREQRGPHVTGKLLVEWDQPRADSGVGVRVVLGLFGGETLQVFLSLRESYLGPEPPNGAEYDAPSVAP